MERSGFERWHLTSPLGDLPPASEPLSSPPPIPPSYFETQKR